MKNKRSLGIFGILVGILFAIGILLPWFKESVFFFGSIHFYPLWASGGYNLQKVKFSYLSYISGGILLIASIMAICSGVYMTAKNRGRASNGLMLTSATLDILSVVIYVIFITKISPDTNGNYFYGSGSIYNYGIEVGFYLEVGLSTALLIVSSIFMI